ncbi:MAG TPA: GGDEF domain-containing protein, partial [Acidimicrobiales bacterium]
SACRAEDVAGRWGGEEFLVVAPTTDVAGAVALAERVRIAIDCAPIDASGEMLTVTASIGAAAGEGDTEELLRRADAALYVAKSSGRNRVSAAG